MATRGWQNVKAIVSPAKSPRKAVQRPQVRRSKFGAIRTESRGITFASKREAAHYETLLLIGELGLIRNLELQPRFALSVNGCVIGAYVADFRYERRVLGQEQWEDVVEDVKGWPTPLYRLKRKLVQAQYGIVVREVR